MDDGLSGSFSDLYGALTDALHTSHTVSNLTKGLTYGFRYRAKNVYGWGPFSPITYHLASGEPDAPPAPTFASATDNSISLTLQPTGNNGGSPVTGYELWMDTGTTGSPFSIVSTYSTSSFTMSHTLSTGADGLVTGKIYSFKWRAKNALGDSEFSGLTLAACSDPPAQAATPTVDSLFSNRSSLYVGWASTADGTAPGGSITGYELYMDDGQGGAFDLVYSSRELTPAINSILVTSLTASLPYRFKVIAYNYNEAGLESSIATFYPCDLPSGFSKPSKVSTTTSSITVSWDEP